MRPRLSTLAGPRRLLWSATAFLFFATSCAGPQERPNILLISLDALRADHLNTYGYARQTAPFLEELAARGQLFSQAYVNTHGTPPSHATILSSVYQETHRVGMQPSGTEPRNDAVPEDLTMVQELLRLNGYRTLAVTDGGYMSRTFGFDRGFDQFFDLCRGIDQGHQKLLEMLSESTEDKPVFALLHTYQIHSPYQPPEEYRTLFGKFPSDFEPTNENLMAIQNDAKSELHSGDIKFLKAMYDGEIRFTDDVLRRLFDDLEDSGFLENALVIVTSDHGEEFADHGGLLHRVSLYNELLRVPLILVGAGVSPGTVDSRLVSSLDIAPTILAAVGLDQPELMEGEDLLAAPEDRSKPRDAVFAQYSSLLYTVVTNRWKLIEWPRSGRLELYDLMTDPGETKNLAKSEEARTRRLRRRLHQWRKSRPQLSEGARPKVQLSPEEAERLRSLGYVN